MRTFSRLNTRLFLVVATALLTACAAPRPATTPVQSPPALPASQMMESSDLAETATAARYWAEQFGTNRVLVVFDLDNTLLAMEQDLGSDQWYDWQKELQAEQPCDARLVTGLLAVQGALYHASAMRLTQPDGPALVQSLQNDGFKVIILTSRGSDFRLATFRELRRGGFSFYASAIGPAQGYADDFIPPSGSRPVRYEDGVFLTAGQHKGDMLVDLLAKTGTPAPAVVVMADDKAKNLQAVMEAFAGSNTSVQAFRYNREDPLVQAFDGTAADQQWRSVYPALQSVQNQFGADNFDLPAPVRPEGCPPAQP